MKGATNNSQAELTRASWINISKINFNNKFQPHKLNYVIAL